MGLKIYVLIFLLVLIIANIIVFLFVREINVIDKFRLAVLDFISRYAPVGDPIIVFLILSLLVISIIALVLVKVFGK